MKAQTNIQTYMKTAIGVLLLSIFTTACSHSSDSGGGGVTANATIAISPNPATVSPSGTIAITASGGTAPYTFNLMSNIGGALASASTNVTSVTFVAGTVTGIVQLQVVDSANNAAYFQITVGSGIGGNLVVTPSSTSVATNGAVTFTASGGTPPYVYSVVTGGGSFVQNIFYAPSTAQTVTVSVHDSSATPLTAQATIVVGGGTSTTASCAGTYNMDLAGYPATLTIIEDSSGHIAGSISLNGGVAAISGSCTSNGTTNTIQFTNLYSGSPYTGTYFPNAANPAQVFMSGTFTDSGYTYNWYATTQ